MEELLEHIKEGKINFLNSPYGITIKLSLYNIISDLLLYNDMVNEIGDSKISDLLSYPTQLRVFKENMDTKKNEVINTLMSHFREDEQEVRDFYNSLKIQTIKDVETGEIYRYVVL